LRLLLLVLVPWRSAQSAGPGPGQSRMGRRR